MHDEPVNFEFKKLGTVFFKAVNQNNVCTREVGEAPPTRNLLILSLLFSLVELVGPLPLPVCPRAATSDASSEYACKR